MKQWSEEQEESLDNLFQPFLDVTEKITNTLAHYAWNKPLLA